MEGYTNLHSSAPTKDQVLVPETLLKKRKSQEQARAARLEELQKRKEVSVMLFSLRQLIGDDNFLYATRLRSMLSLC